MIEIDSFCFLCTYPNGFHALGDFSRADQVSSFSKRFIPWFFSMKREPDPPAFSPGFQIIGF